MSRAVRVAIDDASAMLAASGVDSPRADAEWLLAHVLGVSRGRLLVADDLDDVTAHEFDELVGARARRVPLQHLTGSASFGPVDLLVGPGVFVPRPETELLYEWAVGQARAAIGAGAFGGPGETLTIVDLCSGSGALAIALAVAVPSARLHAVEKSDEAAKWLCRNVERAGLRDRVGIHVGDATDSRAVLSFLDGPVELVVSNPPYVPRNAAVSREVLADPEMAVFGGDDGMSVITPMVEVIAQILCPGGQVGIEHDDSTSGSVVGAVAATGAFAGAEVHRDLVGRPRFVTARRRAGWASESSAPGADDARARMDR
ncbi:peptide chain release factor N(5)-glutamine methyltransferase [Gordonia sp. DT30]|uniref:peptide chain release factor N(5)-glutamine methyltransferase n=1 Tax=unclassified Gordonia (in: high G+C Gram-positive bacteria) TaxID=2657482 RepID=UPI003CF39FF3